MAEEPEKAPDAPDEVPASPSSPSPSPSPPDPGAWVAAWAPPAPGAAAPSGWYPQPQQQPQQPGGGGSSRWQGRLLIAVAALASAAVALSAAALVRGETNNEELARDVVRELNAPFTDEELYGESSGPSVDGVGVSGPVDCFEFARREDPAAVPPKRSPDELDPVVAAGEKVVVSYQLLGCAEPTVITLTVDNVRRQTTAPTEEYPAKPGNGTYLVVDLTSQATGSYTMPDFYSFTALGRDGTVACPLLVDSLFSAEPYDPGAAATMTLVFDVTEDFDVIRFDDNAPGSVSWRL